MKSFKLQQHKGFTLVELMVALSLFTIVVLATISSMLIVNDTARKVQAMRTVMDNLNFAVDTMVRSIRTGYDYSCGNTSTPNCPYPDAGGSSAIGDSEIEVTIDETTGPDSQVQFRLNGGTIERRSNRTGSWGDWQAITAPEITVTTLRFAVNGALPQPAPYPSLPDDNVQPSVTIIVVGTAALPQGQTTPFTIQTKISQRRIE